jgi:pilus assembly protein CpaF
MTPAEAAAASQNETSSPALKVTSFGKRKPPAGTALSKSHSATPVMVAPSAPEVHPKAQEQQNVPHYKYVQRDLLDTPHLKQCLEVIWKSLRDTMDARKMASLSRNEARAEITHAIEVIATHNNMNLSKKEIDRLADCVADEMLGLGPIEQLIARDEVSEIMVNGPNTIYIEVNGLVERSAVTFRDNNQLVSVCQRIASQVGRRVDESSPICDARLPDGSRVNIVLPPLALEGAILTIRKFKKDKLTLDKLVHYGSIDEAGMELIKLISACRVNVMISGGTGSGKTTLLNCLTGYIHPRERIITCEDSAELQLQQPHVLRLETRVANAEGIGEVSMRDLVRNCLRMRPERIIVGEVRGIEAFDLLQAMSTGHDGSMGTVHANNPREAISRIENMIAMNRLTIPLESIRHQISSAVNVIIQVQRFHDGSRKITHISEITGMEGGILSMQDLQVFKLTGEDAHGKITGKFELSGLRPRFYNKLREFGLEHKFNSIIEKYSKL